MMIHDWKNVVVNASSSIIETISVVDSSNLQIALVVDESGRLLGTVTDGDIRRGILRRINMDQTVEMVMHKTPVVCTPAHSREELLLLMQQHSLQHIPIVDKEGVLIGLELLTNTLQTGNKKDNPIVLIAGGEGKRLRPLTDEIPKPLLQIGTKPILETILENFVQYGFHDFYVSVNYRAELIKDYFQDGSKWGADIKYLHETSPLGTAGPLSLLPDGTGLPVLVMNGDLLTTVNFEHLLNFHIEHQSIATMCVREHDIQVPYGVANIKGHNLLEIEEKPVQTFFVNAGVYVLNPEIIKLIPNEKFLDMPAFFNDLIKQKRQVSVFPVREYWMDIGRMDDFNRANGEYHRFF